MQLKVSYFVDNYSQSMRESPFVTAVENCLLLVS